MLCEQRQVTAQEARALLAVDLQNRDTWPQVLRDEWARECPPLWDDSDWEYGAGLRASVLQEALQRHYRTGYALLEALITALEHQLERGSLEWQLLSRLADTMYSLQSDYTAGALAMAPHLDRRMAADLEALCGELSAQVPPAKMTEGT